jgi:hypothetical protein
MIINIKTNSIHKKSKQTKVLNKIENITTIRIKISKS